MKYTKTNNFLRVAIELICKFITSSNFRSTVFEYNPLSHPRDIWNQRYSAAFHFSNKNQLQKQSRLSEQDQKESRSVRRVHGVSPTPPTQHHTTHHTPSHPGVGMCVVWVCGVVPHTHTTHHPTPSSHPPPFFFKLSDSISLHN